MAKPKQKKSDERDAPRTAQSYDSIAAAAAGLGVSKAILQHAKKSGAPGFRGSRVYPEQLLPWLEEHVSHQSQNKEALECEFLRIRIARQKFFFEADKGEFVKASDAHHWATTMNAEVVKVLDAIPSTLAPDVVGCSSIADAELRIRNAIEAAKMTIHDSPWGEKPA